MEEVLAYIESINWDNLVAVCTEFINKLDIPGFFTEVVNFVKDLVAVIAG